MRFSMKSLRVLLVISGLLLLSALGNGGNAGDTQAAAIALTAAERQWLNDHPVIKLAPDPDFKPIEYFSKDGRYQGAAADIIRILEQKLGIKITVVQLKNWDEAMAKFKSHDVDLLGAMVRTPNREKFALFTDTLIAVPGGIFSRSGSITDVRLKDLQGKKVAVVSNYAAHDIIKNQFPEINLDVVSDVSAGLAKASLGMVDAYVENMANATYYAQEAGVTNLQLVGKTEFDYQWGIGIRKDWPELQGILNKGLAAISKEEREEALNRWIYVEGQHWRPTKTIIVGTVASLLGLLLLIVGYWNYALQRKVRSRTNSLQEELTERQKAEFALKTLTGQLEERVRERTRDLEIEIAERSKSELAARASEQRFRELFQNVADPIYISDMSGTIVAANDQACRELGYSPEELLSMHIRDLDAEYDDQDKVAAHFNEYSTSASFTFESVHRRKDASLLPVELSVRIIDFAGQPSVMGVARNISERKRTEEERHKLEQQLLHAQKLESLGVLAGGIAHDFNNILTAIIGNAELAMMRLNPESPVLENLQRIENAAARAADLARQMLAYSGKGRFVIEAIDLNRLIEEMGHMLEVSISKKAVLRYNLVGPLPAIDVDATQIRQIIMNLVINASEAIGEKSGLIVITTGCMEGSEAYLQDAWLTDPIPEGLYVTLEISDTGCGMDKETMGKIFDPFFTTKFTGRGLGMAAVLGIIRGHKGAIKVYSEPDKGSSFKVLLPAGERPVELFNGIENHDHWRGSGVVLLVDDEETVRAIGGEMLRELGFDVVTANDGREAVAQFRARNDISLVILDLTMPHMDGEQCFRELRMLDSSVQVIMSSGFSEYEVTQKFSGKGLAGFIQKPYKLSALREAIKNAPQQS